MKTPDRHTPVLPPLDGYTPGKDWSPGITEHLVDEESGKPIGTKKTAMTAPRQLYPRVWAKKDDQEPQKEE